MRSHGWSGNPPASDEDAIARILVSADRIVAQRGSSMSIADVARDLGVTRQTVYRYFPSTEALLVACAMQKADGFLASRGFILRRMDSYGLPGALRLSIGTEDANREFVAALADFMA